LQQKKQERVQEMQSREDFPRLRKIG
jgi:hypothetical protein